MECWRKKISAYVDEKLNATICVDHEVNYCVVDKINVGECFRHKIKFVLTMK